MPITPIHVDDLRRWQVAGFAGLILDVRTAEDFARQHIPDARNNCVFEVAFSERLAQSAPDREQPVIVCGAGPDSFESRIASEKLERAGYADIRDFRDGVDGWIAAGGATAGTGGQPPPLPPLEGNRPVDVAESRIGWTGRNLLNCHWGSVGLTSGTLQFAADQLVGGSVVVDMTSIRCSDLAGDPLHDVLIAHLKSDDFFDVARHPEAWFLITRVDSLGAAPGAPNLAITGDLTVRGITAQLTLTATAGRTADGRAAAQAVVALDRTAWNVLYGSGRFFRRLGAHLVNDLIEFQLRIVA